MNRGKKYGLAGGLFWGLDTVLLAAAMSKFDAQWAAPIVSTFLHDSFSALYLWIVNGIKNGLKKTVGILRTSSARQVALAALLGGPIGMSGYVFSVYFMGPSLCAVISSLYPALGVLIASRLFKRKISKFQAAGLLISICGIIAMSVGSQPENIRSLPLGLFFGLICTTGWALEGVIVEKASVTKPIASEYALLVRQSVSGAAFALILIPLVNGWNLCTEIVRSPNLGLLALAAFCGTISYLFYYSAIHKIGAANAMPLNATYTVWTVIFSVLILNTIPEWKDLIAGAAVVIGSLMAAREKSEQKKLNV